MNQTAAHPNISLESFGINIFNSLLKKELKTISFAFMSFELAIHQGVSR